MLEALALILAAQLTGELVASVLPLAVPGPVLGMVLLFVAWPHLATLHARLEATAGVLHAHLGLMFVPVCAGVAQHGALLAVWWAPVLLALAASSALTLAGVAWMFSRRRPARLVTVAEHA